MNKFLLLIIALCLFNVILFAQNSNIQTKPDFSGTWLLDKKKSILNDLVRQRYEDYTLTISQSEPELKITKSAIYNGKNKSVTLVFYTDNRGEKNNPHFGAPNIEVESKTHWKDSVLVRTYTNKSSVNGTEIKSDVAEKYELSKDGKTLTITEYFYLNSISPANQLENMPDKVTAKWIFRKKE
jgi:hypothetical protein